MIWPLLIATAVIVGVAVCCTLALRVRNMHLWLPAFCAGEVRKLASARRSTGEIDVLLCIADHFEPHWGGAGDAVAAARVERWVREYPDALGRFRDSDGRSPRHTFFYPIDQYDAACVESIAGLCRAGYGEVEIHLHHDGDTAANLERTLIAWTERLAHRHGLLGRWPDGRLAYGFVHGNWALDNSRPDGRWCGVDNEIEVLARTGCFADFTLPSAPDPTQTRTINSIYYATGCPGRCKSHDRGVRVGGTPSSTPRSSPSWPASSSTEKLMLIQGPLRLWWPGGLRPRIENACLQANQPPTMRRLDQWIKAGVGVPGRPEWRFVKLHTHGAVEANADMLLGHAMSTFHSQLAERAKQDRGFRFHYVTAREMYNLAKAAEAGFEGSVVESLNFMVRAPALSPDNGNIQENPARFMKSPSPSQLANR